MRKTVMYAERPDEAELVITPDRAIAYFRENISEIPAPEEGGQVQYTAEEYDLELGLTANIRERFDANREAWKETAKERAEAEAAAAVRELRDRLLADTDRNVMLDRLVTEFPSGSKITDFLPFLKSLISALTGAMVKYRQALRDIPQQPGFPFNVEWPEPPEDIA